MAWTATDLAVRAGPRVTFPRWRAWMGEVGEVVSGRGSTLAACQRGRREVDPEGPGCGERYHQLMFMYLMVRLYA